MTLSLKVLGRYIWPLKETEKKFHFQTRIQLIPSSSFSCIIRWERNDMLHALNSTKKKRRENLQFCTICPSPKGVVSHPFLSTLCLNLVTPKQQERGNKKWQHDTHKNLFLLIFFLFLFSLTLLEGIQWSVKYEWEEEVIYFERKKQNENQLDHVWWTPTHVQPTENN